MDWKFRMAKLVDARYSSGRFKPVFGPADPKKEELYIEKMLNKEAAIDQEYAEIQNICIGKKES